VANCKENKVSLLVMIGLSAALSLLVMIGLSAALSLLVMISVRLLR